MFGMGYWFSTLMKFNSWHNFLFILVIIIVFVGLVRMRSSKLKQDQDFVTQNLFEELPIALIVVDNAGDVRNINYFAREICGLLDKQGKINIYNHEQEKDHLLSYLVQTLQGQKTFHEQYYTYQLGEELRYLCLSTTTITNEWGKTKGGMLIAWHISEQSFLGRHLSQGGKLAMIGEIAAGTAHEIRNPLTSVKGLLQIIARRFTPEDPAQNHISVMLKEINQINHIIKELLLLARRTTPNLSFSSIPMILDQVLTLMDGEATGKGITIVRCYKEDLPLIVLDEDQIKQVFWHLISNAIHAMPNGGELTILALYSENEETVEISFIDTGIGIDKENLSNIFHPFFTTRPEGTGLGLPVSYQIVDNHGGKLSVKSSVGKGSSFMVKLPLVNYKNLKAS